MVYQILNDIDVDEGTRKAEMKGAMLWRDFNQVHRP